MESKRNVLGVGNTKFLNRDGTIKDGVKGFNYEAYNRDIIKHNIKHLKGKQLEKKQNIEKHFDNMAHVLSGELMDKMRGKQYIGQGNLNKGGKVR
ncbi:MAG: hypothetical protein KKB59_19615 [Spirochaetes bacterium]|nr:hypothetical protein [Spirochaetota bacterium]